jgi:hypothetical protein
MVAIAPIPRYILLDIVLGANDLLPLVFYAQLSLALPPVLIQP